MKKFLQPVIFALAVSFFFSGKLFSQGNADTIFIGTNGVSQTTAYFPSSISVHAGDSILFIVAGSGHPTIPLNNLWTTPNPIPSSAPGQKYQVKITSTPGTYNYYCQNHGFPTPAGMFGTIIVSAATGINDPKEPKFEFSAVPNPFEDQLSLDIAIGNKNITEIKIYDLIGKEVTSVNLSGKTGFHSYKVDTSNLRAGIYFCTVYTANGILETKKLFRRN